MKCVKTPLSKAEETKIKIKEFLNPEYRPKKEGDYIYFPVTNNYKGETVEHEVNKSKITIARPFKEVLAEILTPKELEEAKHAYEMIGDLAIIEIPDVLFHKEKEIGNILLQSNPMIKTVLGKVGGHEGVFRTQQMKYIAGKETKEATYKENNCTLTFNVQEVYFSTRLSTERKRIGEQVQAGEKILVMFSGAAPYPCVLSKNTEAKEIIGIEINPEGHKYGLMNIKKNKSTNVTLYNGDVRVVVPTIHKKFDRIIMPLPRTAEEFLDCALSVANPGCTIHLYGFYHEEEFDKAIQEIRKYCEIAKREYTIKEITKCGQQSPRTYRICVDFMVK